MEKLVTKKIEDELEGISEIRRHESQSFDSTSKIHILFNTRLSEYEIDQAMQKVRNAVDRVDDLPEEAKVPRVIEIEIALFPVCMVGLSGGLPLMQLQDIARDIADTLENIDGVSEVDILGEREQEIWVELDPRRMSAYGITVAQVAQAIAARVKNLPGGILEMEDQETAIRMLGEPATPAGLGGMALKAAAGATVYLRDIAAIAPTLEKAAHPDLHRRGAGPGPGRQAQEEAPTWSGSWTRCGRTAGARRPVPRAQDDPLFRPVPGDQEADPGTPDQRLPGHRCRLPHPLGLHGATQRGLCLDRHPGGVPHDLHL